MIKFKGGYIKLTNEQIQTLMENKVMGDVWCIRTTDNRDIYIDHYKDSKDNILVEFDLVNGFVKVIEPPDSPVPGLTTYFNLVDVIAISFRKS
jgi:hypothetical protein